MTVLSTQLQDNLILKLELGFGFGRNYYTAYTKTCTFTEQ